MVKKKFVRIQFEVDSGELAKMDATRQMLGLRTRTQFFNYAINLVKWCMKERLNGRIIASVDETSGKYKELVIGISPDENNS